MRETGTNVKEYLQHYQKSWRKLQSRSKPERHYPHGNLLETWLVSYNEIKKRDQNTAELMLLFAHFDNRDIWHELVKCGTHSSNRPVWFDNVISDRLDFKETMRTLIGFSFIEVNKSQGSYMMHPVVQDWCLYIIDIEHDAKSGRLDELALICVGYMAPSRNERNYWEIERRLLAHADYVCQKWRSDQGTTDIAIWGALNGLGILYRGQGKLTEAEEMFQQALAGYVKVLGPDHMSTLDSVNNLGILYSHQGKLVEAEEMYQ